MPNKICKFNGCKNKIKLNEVYCEEHKNKAKANHNLYKEKRNDLFEQRFYKLKPWILTREIVKARDFGLCKVCLSNKVIRKLGDKLLTRGPGAGDNWKFKCWDNIIRNMGKDKDKIY